MYETLNLARYFIILKNASVHARELSGAVLDHARESSYMASYSINSVINSCNILLRKKFKKDLIKVDIQVKDFYPQIPKSCVHQIILNILTNAYDALLEKTKGERLLLLYSESRKDYEEFKKKIEEKCGLKKQENRNIMLPLSEK